MELDTLKSSKDSDGKLGAKRKGLLRIFDFSHKKIVQDKELIPRIKKIRSSKEFVKSDLFRR